MTVLLLAVLFFFATILSLLFGWLLGVKFYELFDCRCAALVGPAAALALGIAFGIKGLGPAAGIVAGTIGAIGCAIALYRQR